MILRSYATLCGIDNFDDRFDYLKLDGVVGHSTFGFDRHLNQSFYNSSEWRNVRDAIIVRDNGCDLGVLGREIHEKIIIHHVNPIIPDDIIDGNEWILEPDFLITTTQTTHNAIHYGNRNLLISEFTERKPGDTKLW